MAGTLEIGLLSHVMALTEKPSVSKEYADSRRKPTIDEKRKTGHQTSRKQFVRGTEPGEDDEPPFLPATGGNVDITL
jgi:hypothetical protein